MKIMVWIVVSLQDQPLEMGLFPGSTDSCISAKVCNIRYIRHCHALKGELG